MSPELEERIWGYLDRLLSADEVERFERDLLDPAVAQAFGKALMMRELLKEIEPDEAPDALVTRLEKVVVRDVKRARESGSRGVLRSTLAGLAGLRWAVVGPQNALAGVDGTRTGIGGVGTTRYSLGPIAGRTGASEAKPKPKRRRALWKRALRLGRKKKAKKPKAGKG